MQDYANCGGRMFGSHWHNYWVEHGPDPWPGAANFNHQADLAIPITADIDTSFPRGQAMAEWLFNTGGSTVMGQIDIYDAQHTITSVNSAQQWITIPDTLTGNTPSVQYLSFETPLGAEPADLCGKVVLS